MANTLITVCATGGGAYKFEKDFLRELNMQLHKFDELDSLMSGLQFIEQNNPKELYFWENPEDDESAEKVSFDFRDPYPFMLVNVGSGIEKISRRTMRCTFTEGGQLVSYPPTLSFPGALQKNGITFS